MKLGILTSGGDAPGMNACIRALVRILGTKEGQNILGYQSGYRGLVENNYEALNLRSVANIVHRGGTILRTSRYLDFKKVETREKALENMKQENLTDLVVLGGDGSFKGCSALKSFNSKIRVHGIPCTIDNDVPFGSYSIGFDSAVNTGMYSIDKIRDTANSHERVFLIEVMGRDSFDLAQEVALAAGAEDILVPGDKVSLNRMIKSIERGVQRGKKASLIVVAEGSRPQDYIFEVQKEMESALGIKPRVCVLGHTQRGGSPSRYDRNAAALFADQVSKNIKNKIDGILGMNEYGVIETQSWAFSGENKEFDHSALIRDLAN